MNKHLVLSALLFVSLLGACSGSNTPATPTTPSATTGGPTASGDKVSFSTANAIVTQRCHMCHAGTNPRGGVRLDSGDQMKKLADRIKARAVTSKGMPQGNVTNMTDGERQTLGAWIDQGASLQ